MTEKQYLEAVQGALGLLTVSSILDPPRVIPTSHEIYEAREETERRLQALKAQEDNIKSDHWEEEEAIEILGDNWEDFKEYVDGIDDWGMSDVERYMNR